MYYLEASMLSEVEQAHPPSFDYVFLGGYCPIYLNIRSAQVSQTHRLVCIPGL